MDIKRIIRNFVIGTVVVCVCMIALWGYTRYYSTQRQTVELGTDDSDCRFTYVISKSWSETAHDYRYGVQCDLEVENRMPSTMNDWTITLELNGGGEIDSSWNGNFDVDGDIITITSVDYNDTVTPNEMQPFGMVLHVYEEDCIKSGTFSYCQDKKMVENPLFWILVLAMFTHLIVLLEGLYYERKNRILKEKQKASRMIINQSFATFANTIDAKDTYTKGHSQRVAYYSRELSKRLGFDEQFQQDIFYVGLLHDIGKIGVQDAILKKSAKLTYDEFNEIKEHVSMGGDILKKFTAINGIEDGARYHHERYDGNGYMEGLKGEEIPILARIIAVADAFDAMSSERCYRKPLSNEDIIVELEKCSGAQFDPNIVPHMIDMIKEGAAPIVLEEGQLETELELM